MEPFGFKHLRISLKPKSTQRSLNPYLKKSCIVSENFKSKSAVQEDSFSRLFVPVNIPICRFQLQAAAAAVRNNVLLALPDAMDSSFISFVVAFNFRRWFLDKTILFIASSLEGASKMRQDFTIRTGYPTWETCTYPDMLKKTNRNLDCSIYPIIFSTAENLIGDLHRFSNCEIGLVIIEEAERATNGSHSVCVLIRNLLLTKASFRIIAVSNSDMKKVAALQSVITNLQIGYIYSVRNVRDDIKLSMSSPKLITEYISLTSELTEIATALLQAVSPLIELLGDASVIPTKHHRELVNFSLTFLQKKLYDAPYFTSYFNSLSDLLDAYDILMCEGLTAFATELQEIISKNEEVCRIVESNEVLKAACISAVLSRNQFSFHKLNKCFELIERTLLNYGTEKSIIVILCRDRSGYWVTEFLSTLIKQLPMDSVHIISCSAGHQNVTSLIPSSMKFGKCNIIVIPCGHETFKLDVGYVDTVICLDEGLSLLHYIGGINVSNEGNVYALCTACYEVNVYPLDSEEYVVDTVQASLTQAVNLCKDDVKIFPTSWNPEFLEYWAHFDQREGFNFPSAYEEISVNERAGTSRTIKDMLEKTMSSENLILSEIDSSFLWLDALQKSFEVHSSRRAMKVAEVVGAKNELLSEESKRFAKQINRDDDSILVDSILDISNCASLLNLTNEENLHSGQHPSTSKKRRKQIRKILPPVKPTVSTSISSILTKENKVTAEMFCEATECQEQYMKRVTLMEQIIDQLKNVLTI